MIKDLNKASENRLFHYRYIMDIMMLAIIVLFLIVAVLNKYTWIILVLFVVNIILMISINKSFKNFIQKCAEIIRSWDLVLWPNFRLRFIYNYQSSWFLRVIPLGSDEDMFDKDIPVINLDL